jgi:hypothetical protein
LFSAFSWKETPHKNLPLQFTLEENHQPHDFIITRYALLS